MTIDKIPPPNPRSAIRVVNSLSGLISNLQSKLVTWGCCVFLCIASGAWADDWHHWRGPNRNGVIKESSHFSGGDWLPRQPAWSRGFGIGCTSPLVVAGKLYAMGHDGRRDNVYCVEAATGKDVWKVGYASPAYGRHSDGDKGFYAGPCSTPEFDEETGYLYTLGIDGDLNCWDTRAAGRQVWSLNLYKQYTAPMRPRVGRSGRRDYGYTSSPLVLGDTLIVEVGAPEGNLMGFEKRTGRRLWASQAKDPAGHNGGPTPITVEGVACVAVLNHAGLLVVRLDKGRQGHTVAQHPWVTSFANNIASPTVHGDSVLITSGYNQEKICRLKITLAGATKVWESEVHSKVCSPVVYKGHVYWVWQNLYCLDWQTGKLVWQRRGQFSDPGSCLVTGDGRLVAMANAGRLLLAETAERAASDAKVLAEHGGLFRQDAWPHVVLADGRLFCKDKQGNIKCFALKRE
jgi:outer membrane protein assembly factor BamB